MKLMRTWLSLSVMLISSALGYLKVSLCGGHFLYEASPDPLANRALLPPGPWCLIHSSIITFHSNDLSPNQIARF